MNKKSLSGILNWIARIWSIFSILFILVFFVGSFLQSPPNGESVSVLTFIFFPISLLIGLILSWKWKIFGGLIAVISIILFHLTVEPEFVLFIEFLAFPGLLFLTSGFLQKNTN